MDKYIAAIQTIVKMQEQIVGPNVAQMLAGKVATLSIDAQNNVNITGDPKQSLKELIEQYSLLFGPASIEVCKDAVMQIDPAFTPEELPDNLK